MHRPSTSTAKANFITSTIAAVTAGLAGAAGAAPYASGIMTSGSSVDFVLNENAGNVTVVFDGGTSSQDLGALNAGTHTFDLTGHTSYQIQASGTGPAGYTFAGQDAFYSPKGISINTLPATANFGDIYVSESTAGTPSATVPGPARNVGFYKLRADRTEEDFGTAGLTRTGSQTYGKTTIGPDGALYNADFSSDLAFQISDDLDSNTQLIDATNKRANQFVVSIAATGTGAGRQIYLANANFSSPAADKAVFRYDLPAATVAANDLGTKVVDAAQVDNFFASDLEVDNAGNVYVAVNRFTAGQADAIVKVGPSGNVLFQVPNTYTGANSLALHEGLGLLAYGSFYDGTVNIFDSNTGAFIESFAGGDDIRDLAFDAAGNIYTVSSLEETLKFFARGTGSTAYATTGSDGTFALEAAVVPEPTSLALLGVGGIALCTRRRRS